MPQAEHLPEDQLWVQVAPHLVQVLSFQVWSQAFPQALQALFS
jgi:hypothetical protein